MRRLAFILVPLLVLACSERPTTAPAAPAPSFDFSNGPAVPGHSYIVRNAYGGFFWWGIDPKTELAVWITDDDFDCADFANATPVPFQMIFSPAEEGLQMYFEGGWLNALIVAPPYECDDVLATGLVHNFWTDNDLYAWLFDHNRANAGGGGFNGRVGGYTVSWIWRILWGGMNDTTRPFIIQEHIIVK